jgi:anhydro-N-acetylmuramic acid kinase
VLADATALTSNFMVKNKQFHVIGLMSGTSLDGLDIAYCVFEKENSKWNYQIKKAVTIKYASAWSKKLSQGHLLSGEDLIALDAEYGIFLGETVKKFVVENKLKIDFISSHGHTIFHQPDKTFTYQIGNGNSIYAVTKIPVIFDFRTLDVHLGGQGAPLVPIGDRLLFSDYDVCLNLGGIANLSVEVKKERKAFDLCFCNMGLNYLASKAGKSIDKDGNMAERGEINQPLLRQLQKVYTGIQDTRPSLGRELFERKIQNLLDKDSIPLADRLRTFTESIALEIVSVVKRMKPGATVLCTGGGSFNRFLISRMLDLGGDEISWVLPEDDIIKFKEALVFAFLGVLKTRGDNNCLKSVTQASQDSSGGVMIGF